jgi:hypothetical protein
MYLGLAVLATLLVIMEMKMVLGPRSGDMVSGNNQIHCRLLQCHAPLNCVWFTKDRPVTVVCYYGGMMVCCHIGTHWVGGRLGA